MAYKRANYAYIFFGFHIKLSYQLIKSKLQVAGMRFSCIIIALLLFLEAPIMAAENQWQSMLAGFKAGLGGSITTNEYKDMSGNVTSPPLLGYEGEYLYLRGVSGGFHFFRNEWLELNVQLSYLPQHFYAEQSDDWAMRRLDDRYSTLMGGFNGRLISKAGILTATISTDLLGTSNGILLDASYSYPFELGIVKMAPTFGIQWTDVNYNNYYYGVDHNEARRSGLKYYDPESACSQYVQLSASLDITENWSTFGSVRTIFLSPAITDSPMVEASEKYSFSLGVFYSF